MAVIQISKIQQRRGRKLSDIGVPQLSSGELAWAVDTQELFIGNGSITEGAPYVGNTKVLTEHDNILELVSSYRFAEPDINIVGSVERSLQSKLDETVSVIDFGAVPDGSTDCTQAFETAFDELFKNPDEKYKKILFIPNGTYAFFRDLKIPSGAILKGENPKKTILDIDNNSIIYVSENGTDGINNNFDSSDRPHDIDIISLTIKHNSGQTVISAGTECSFRDVTWLSEYIIGVTTFVPVNASATFNSPVISSGGKFEATIFGSQIDVFYATSYEATLINLVGILESTPSFNNFFSAEILGSSIIIKSKSQTDQSSFITDNFTLFVQEDNISPGGFITPITEEFKDGSESVNASVYWDNKNFGTSTTKNKFVNCNFISTPLAIECRQDLVFDSEIDFQDCRFFINDVSIYISGVPPVDGISQGNFWNIKDCNFENIANQAFISTYGIGTKIISSTFKNCGNGNSSPATPISSIVKFGEKFNNVLVNCSSDRHQKSAITNLDTKVSIVEFENASNASLIDRNFSQIFYSEGFRTLAVLPIKNRYIEIDYFLSLGRTNSSNYSRVGKLIITISDDLAEPGAIVGGSSEVAISDNYVYSPSSPTSPGGSFMTNFEFGVELRNNSLLDDSSANLDTILLAYRNPSGSSVTGFVSYSITYGV